MYAATKVTKNKTMH